MKRSYPIIFEASSPITQSKRTEQLMSNFMYEFRYKILYKYFPSKQLCISHVLRYSDVQDIVQQKDAEKCV